MKRIPKFSPIFLCLLALLILTLGGCKAYRNIENLSPKNYREKGDEFNLNALDKLNEGDKIRIVSINGAEHHMEFIKMEDGKLKGMLSKTGERQLQTSENFELEIDQIEKLEVYRKSPALTGVVIYIIVIGITGLILGGLGAGASVPVP